jgi:hypothetical protein
MVDAACKRKELASHLNFRKEAGKQLSRGTKHVIWDLCECLRSGLMKSRWWTILQYDTV